jgi:diacylglycerol kinase
MVCCALIAGLLGLLMPWRRRGALAWRPGESVRPGFLSGRWRSVGYALSGLTFAVRYEANMRVHMVAAAGVVSAGVALRLDVAEWRWLVVAIAMVVAGEALNTGIEQACNAIGGRSEAIRRAKDTAAGGVLVLAVGALLIGASVFAPHMMPLWRGLPVLPICGDLSLGS